VEKHVDGNQKNTAKIYRKQYTIEKHALVCMPVNIKEYNAPNSKTFRALKRSNKLFKNFESLKRSKKIPKSTKQLQIFPKSAEND